MCDGHSDATVDIGPKTISVDHCIAPLVKILNTGGYRTIASCCGHHDQAATIPLLDLDGTERWLILTRDRAEGERMMWPTNEPPRVRAAARVLADYNRRAVAGFRVQEIDAITLEMLRAAEQDTRP